MSASAPGNIVAPNSRFVQCPQCEQKLPLRTTGPEDESPGLWKCGTCDSPIAGFCEQALLVRNPQSVLLDERYFDVGGVPEINQEERRRACLLTRPAAHLRESDRRRSVRTAQSFVAPAIALTESLTPLGGPLRVIVANLSREGIGLVHPGRIEAGYLAMLLGSREETAIQVIVRIIRHLQLEEPYFEIGGELFLRLGPTGVPQPS